MRPNELWTCPDTEPPGQGLPLVVSGGSLYIYIYIYIYIYAPFEEQEEGIGIASDVVKVEEADPTARSVTNLKKR